MARTAWRAQALRTTGRMVQARRFGASSGRACRRKNGASRPEVRRSRRDGSDAVVPEEAGPPPRVIPGLAKPVEPSRGVSRVYRKTSKIGGENRAIQDRRRQAGNESRWLADTGRCGLFREVGMPRWKHRGMTALKDVGDNVYSSGNGASMQFANAGSGLRRGCGPKDPKGSWMRPVAGRATVLRGG